MARALRGEVLKPDVVGVYHFANDVLADAILSNHFHLVLRTRAGLVAKMSDREVVTAWLMICPKSPGNQDGTAKSPTEEEIRAGLADSLEGHQQASIGERLRTLDGEPVDTSRWLAPLELAGETDGEPVKVVNRLDRKELDEFANAGAGRPLGCLPMRLDEYAELLRWLAGNQSNARADAGSANSSAASAEAAGDSIAILRRLSLDPAAFAASILSADAGQPSPQSTPREQMPHLLPQKY